MSRASRASLSVSWIAPTIAGLLCTQLACSFDSLDHLGNGVKRDAEVVNEAGGGGFDVNGPGPDQAAIDLSSVDGPVFVASEVGGHDDRGPETDGTGLITDGADGDAGQLAGDTKQDTAMVETGGVETETEVVDGSMDAAVDVGSGGSPEIDSGAGGGGGTDAGIQAQDADAWDSGDAPFGVVDSSEPSFPYVPTNFDPSGLAPDYAGSTVVLNCGVSTFDSSTSSFDNWCGQTPAVVKRTQAGGPDAVILALPSFTVAPGATLRLVGAYPVVLAVFDDAIIAGTIDASANGTTPGPGGNLTCGTSQGADGNGSPARFSGASGGGGGGFGTAGGNSGMADTDNSDGKNPAAAGGQVRGGTKQSPLMGGCAGGRAGGCSSNGGAGGGAIQISAGRTLTVTGAILANGADGTLPCGPSDEGGGTGGGSGGGILLEAKTVLRFGATLAANGGSGGTDGTFYHCGDAVGGAGSTDPSKPGADGMSCVAGSPGGGGGYGRISVANR